MNRSYIWWSKQSKPLDLSKAKPSHADAGHVNRKKLPIKKGTTPKMTAKKKKISLVRESYSQTPSPPQFSF